MAALSEVGAVISPVPGSQDAAQTGAPGEPGETRSIQNPAVPLTSARALEYIGGAGTNSAGVDVTPETAVGVSAILAAVNILSRTIAGLPATVVHTVGRDKIKLDDHPAAVLLDRDPNDEMTAQIFREVLLNNLQLYGDAFALIERDKFTGDPLELIPLPSASTRLERSNGLVRVISRMSDGVEIAIRATDVLYIPGFTMTGLDGRSAITLAPDVVGISIGAQNYAGGFYANGQTLAGVLEFPGSIGEDDDVQRIRKSWQDLHAGERNAYKVAILEQGMKFQTIAVSPEQGQLLQTRKFQVDEIARLMGVPPHLLFSMERATFSNIEEMGASFLRYWLTPWILRLEQEANRKLLSEREKRSHKVKLNVNALLRGDSKGRAAYYKEMKNSSAITTNEIRAFEDLPPVEGGDEIFVPLNMTTLDKAIAIDPDPQPTPETAPTDPAIEPDAQADPVEPNDQADQVEPVDEQNAQAAENIVEGAKLNGAQITSAVGLVEGVVNGTLPDVVALELLIALGIEKDKATGIINAAKNFEAEDPDPNAPDSSGGGTGGTEFDATRSRWIVDSVRRLVNSEIPSLESRARKYLQHKGGADLPAFRADLVRYYDKFETRAAEILSGPLGDTDGQLLAARISRRSLEALKSAPTAATVIEQINNWKKTKIGEIVAEVIE
jgi:HK97 family phage portal protein